MTKSSLGSKVDRLARHLRWTEDSEGWGGDAEIALGLLSDSLPLRHEWVEGSGEGWNLWVFEEDADVQVDDILLIDDVGLALYVTRKTEKTTLDGEFHHYQLVAQEHEQSLGQLDAQIQ